MVDTKQLSKELRSLIKTASKSDRDSIEEQIDESQLSDSMKVKLHEELQVRLNESEQEVIDETVAAGKKEEAQDLIDRKQEEINSEKDLRELPTVSVEIPKHKAVSATEEQVMEYQKQGKLVGWDPKTKIAKILASVLILAMAIFQVPAFAADTTDEAVLGNNRWSVQNDGDLVPNANTYSIGSATQYPASIWINGAEYSSFAAGTDGNWTGDGLTTTLDAAPTKFIATHSSGDMFATGFTVGTGDLTFAQGGKLDGDTNGTLKLIEASDTLSFIFSGSTIQLDSSDGGFQFGMTSETEGYVDFLTNNDTSDYLRISTVANVPTIVTVGTCNLEIAPDGGTTTVTGALTATGLVTATGGVTSSTTVTLENAETIVNSTNNVVEVGGGTGTTLSVLDAGTADSDAALLLRADASADNADDWQLVSDGATNSFFLQNDTSGSQATIVTVASTGLVTTTGDLTVAGTTPLVTIGDGGDEDAGIQINSDTNDFYIASENGADDLVIGLGSAIGTTPIISMTDTGVTTVTGSTDGDLTVYGAGTTASDAYLRLVGDADADVSDGWQLWNDTSDAALYFGNDSAVAGTYVTKLGLTSTGVINLVNAETIDNSVNNTVTIGSAASMITKLYSSNATNGTVSLQLVGDAAADATDGFEIINSANGTLTIGNDSTASGTYIAKMTLDSTGAMTVQGSEATAASIAIWADNGDDAADKFTVAIDAADSVTLTTGVTLAQTISTAGLTTLAAGTVTGATLLNGAVTLGDNIADVVTVTGKVAGATPLSFDGTTADTNYTILAVGDAASSSKTVTLPSVTGTVALETATSALTAGAAVALTVVPGTDKVYTDLITTDNEDQTITFSAAGTSGDRVTIIFTTDTGGSGDEVITFHNTLCRSTGTLTLANGTATSYVVSFVSNGTTWLETSRTAVQAAAS